MKLLKEAALIASFAVVFSFIGGNASLPIATAVNSIGVWFVVRVMQRKPHSD
jgi:hypothetical protein